MKEISIGDTKVVFYSSIKELPVHVSKKMQAYLLQDAGIGSTIEDIDTRLERIMMFAQSDKRQETVEEAHNLRFSLFTATSEMDFKSTAFGCLIKSVDDKAANDYTQEGLSALITNLSSKGLTIGDVEEILEDVKKNLIRNEAFTSLKSLEMM